MAKNKQEEIEKVEVAEAQVEQVAPPVENSEVVAAVTSEEVKPEEVKPEEVRTEDISIRESVVGIPRSQQKKLGKLRRRC